VRSPCKIGRINAWRSDLSKRDYGMGHEVAWGPEACGDGEGPRPLAVPTLA
jgi:hypothetical protein